MYEGEFVDTVFFTESKKQLKLALILKAIALLKRGNWPINVDDLWPMGEGEEEEGEAPEGSQSETTTPVEETTAEETTPRPVTMVANRGGEAAKKPWIKKGIAKVFKLLKWVPKVIHKKKHLIFH